jgi:Uma2 family endonuclease
MSTQTLVRRKPEIEYPDSDGQPMSDNTLQFQWIVTLQGGLDALFRDDPDVFVAGDLLWYPVAGNIEIRIAPDAMVAFGRSPGHRGSYVQCREDGIAPQVTFEVLSPGNTRTEMRHKREFYERYGVEEYYEYDPDRGTLKGWLRRDGRLEPIARMEDWISPRLGIRFSLEGTDLVLYRPDGRRFETFVELDRRAQRSRAEGVQEGLQQGLQQALDRLIASGMEKEQAKRLLGLA